jgi:hypothetical protein
MFYPMDAQTGARTRKMEWEREMAAMQLAKSASDTPQGRSAAGNAMGRLVVDLLISARASLTGKRARTA